jgi:ComF family protein
MLLDFLFPPRCGGCRHRGARLCMECRKEIVNDYRKYKHCPDCDHPLSQGICFFCSPATAILSGMRLVGTYSGALHNLIHTLKFRGQRELAAPLASLLAETWQARGTSDVQVIVAIPMQRDRQRARGYNVADLLARNVARQLRVPYIPDALYRTRSAPTQHGLDLAARYLNVRGLFDCAPHQTRHLMGKQVLVIDDVTTTGATLVEIATELRRHANVTSVWGLALAAPLMRQAMPA